MLWRSGLLVAVLAVVVVGTVAGVGAVSDASGEAMQDEPGDTWNRTYGPGLEAGEFLDGTAAADDGYLLVGWFGSREDPSAWALHVDERGDVEWVWSLQGYGSSVLTSVVALEDGEFLVAGTRRLPEEGEQRFVARLTPDGSIAWRDTYGPGAISDAVRVSDGGALVVGGGRGQVLAPAGTGIWSETYDGTDLRAAERLDDGYVLAGTEADDDGNGVVLRVDGTGETEWRRTTDGSGPATVTGVAVSVDRIYAGGTAEQGSAGGAVESNGTAFFAEYGLGGSLERHRTFGHRDGVSVDDVASSGSVAVLVFRWDGQGRLARAENGGLAVLEDAVDGNPQAVTALDDGRYLVAGERNGEGFAAVVGPRFGGPSGAGQSVDDDEEESLLGESGNGGSDEEGGDAGSSDDGIAPPSGVGGVPPRLTLLLLVAAAVASVVAIAVSVLAWRRL